MASTVLQSKGITHLNPKPTFFTKLMIRMKKKKCSCLVILSSIIARMIIPVVIQYDLNQHDLACNNFYSE